MNCSNKECYNAFKAVVAELSALVGEPSLSWEEKHTILFYSTDLSKRVCEAGNMTVSDLTSSNQQEIIAFYEAAKSKVSYLSYYFEK